MSERGRDDQGYELGRGMVMTLARIASVDPTAGGFIRFTVHAPLIAKMRPRGYAPVFKIFLARSHGSPMALPTFDEHRLAVPSWEADPSRPIARAYTALGFMPGDDHIVFDALRPGWSGSWVDRAAAGDIVGVIGFKHELVIDERCERLILIGDRSSAPARSEIARTVPSRLAVRIIEIDGLDSGEVTQLVRQALVDGPVATTQVWIGGEVSAVAGAREAALDMGIAASQIVALPYWHRGLSREEYDRVLYRRYREAADAGETISSPEVAARIELHPVDVHRETGGRGSPGR